MTKQEKIDAIYEALADKTLSDGCKFAYEGYLCVIGNAILNRDLVDISWQSSTDIYSVATKDITIIGHPVRIGDVIEYVRLKNIWNINSIADEWDYPRLSIDEQSDYCISFVYNLIK